MTQQDKQEFQQYLATLTWGQLHGVLEKEQLAGRADYAELARLAIVAKS
ncbi:hypothetical protein ACO0LG_08565 [Undibacterium sp. Ji42W]